MKMISLQTEARPENQAKFIRSEGKVPCVLYGNDVEHTQLTCDYSELYRTYAKAGESVLVELDIAGKKVPVLFHELQFEPVSDAIVHVDFFAVDMKKEIEARVPLHFEGESPAVKELGGVLVSVMDHVSVKCLPTALPSHLEVNIEKLESFTDSIIVSDIVIPSGVTISDDSESMIATVQEPRKEVELEPEAAVEGAEDAEGEGGEKVEGGEGSDAPAAKEKSE
jgi:large subunit ribosomal protein L25